jgi:hypothetical protein
MDTNSPMVQQAPAASPVAHLDRRPRQLDDQQWEPLLWHFSVLSPLFELLNVHM